MALPRLQRMTYNAMARLLAVAALATAALGQQSRRSGGFGGGGGLAALGGGGASSSGQLSAGGGVGFAGNGGFAGLGGGGQSGRGGNFGRFADRFGLGGAQPPAPGPTPAGNVPIPNQQLQTQTTVTQFTDANSVPASTLGDSFNMPRATGGGGARAAFAAASMAAPASLSLATAPPPAAPVALFLRNGCAGAKLQAAARVADAAGGWQTLGFFELKPNGTAEAGAAAGGAVDVFAREAGGRGCDAGGRCWRGDSGPWPLPGDAAGGSEKFFAVRVPAGQDSFTYTFEC